MSHYLSQEDRLRLFEHFINQLVDEGIFPRLTPQEIRKASAELAKKFEYLPRLHSTALKECLKILTVLHLLETNPNFRTKQQRQHVFTHPEFELLLTNFCTRLDLQHQEKFAKSLLKKLDPKFKAEDFENVERPRPEPSSAQREDKNEAVMDDLLDTLTLLLGGLNPYFLGSIPQPIARFIPNYNAIAGRGDAFGGTGLDALESDTDLQTTNSPDLAPGEEPGMHVPTAGAPSNRNWPPRLTPFDTKK